jgi:hypothetical protein
MTVEQTTFVTAGELEKIVFVCVDPGCKATVAVPIKAEMEPVWACPVCSENWFRDKKERVEGFKALVTALVELKRTDAPFSLHLQLRKSLASTSDKSEAS